MSLLDALLNEKDNEKDDIMRLCDVVRETSFAIHRFHRSGHRELIYANALMHRLRKMGYRVEREYELKVYDEDGTELGEYFADLFLENRLIIEVKACSAIVGEHIAQLLGYMRSARVEHGLLVNFGAQKLQIKKFILGAERYE